MTIRQTMKTIKVVIGKTKDMYTAYAQTAQGIYADGDTVEEVKHTVLDAIQLMKEYQTKEEVPDVLKGDYQVVYQYDIASLLNNYKGILSNSSVKRLTGINQKLLQHYAAGLVTPREPQRKKIENALHKLGSELLSIELNDFSN